MLRTMAELWRIHKSRVKAEYYTKYSTDVERLQNRPTSIPLEKFKVLLEYWGDEAVQNKAQTNAGNRKKVTDVHNAGRTSFAQIGKDMVCQKTSIITLNLLLQKLINSHNFFCSTLVFLF